MKQSFWTRKIYISILITLMTASLVAMINLIIFPTLSKLNLLTKDTLIFGPFFSTNTTFNKDILVIEIDDKTLKDKDSGGLGRWQDFKRSYYAKVIDNLNRDGAIVIGLDVLFDVKFNDPNEDIILSESIKRAGNVVLDYSIKEDIYPIEILKKSTGYLGEITPNINKYNNTIYSWIAHYIYGGEVYESFAMSVLRAYYDNLDTNGEKHPARIEDISDKGFYIHGNFIPYSGNNTNLKKNTDGSIVKGKEFLINFIPDKDMVNTASFIDIYNGKYDPSIVNNKIVLIGSTATALHDEYSAPIISQSSSGIIPGVYFHAMIINTVLNQKYIYYLKFWKEVLIFFLFIYAISFSSSLVKSEYSKYLYIGGIIIFPVVFIIGYGMSYKLGSIIISNPATFVIGIIISTVAGIIYRYFYEDKGKRILKNALAQYVSSELAEEILLNYEEVKLREGTEREIIIFFSDIESFTKISEHMETRELFNFIRDYLKEMSDVIIEYKGHINKYEGDAIMALWGNFNDLPGKARLACLTAIGQMKKLEELNKKYKYEYGFQIKIRIGINEGKAKVGNIGSEGSKLEFTALGDNVNLASRLEGINKYYGTHICISESTKESAGNEFVYRLLDDIKVKGRKNIERIYELVGLKTDVSQDKLDTLREFEKALSLYQNKMFKEAHKMFKELAKKGDRPSIIFAIRCSEFEKNDPGETWKGVWEFSEK